MKPLIKLEFRYQKQRPKIMYALNSIKYVIYISIFSNMYALRYISMMIELALYSDRRYVHCTKTYYV